MAVDASPGRPADRGPLLVFGPRSLDYDFGEGHPLTPRRFGPGISLLEAIGAEPGLAPEPASEADLQLAHTAEYVAAVRRFSDDPFRPPERGIGPGDTPAFEGMHEAAAAVADGSLRAMEAILQGDVVHAHHPGGGLHHAMADRGSGFCVYDDVGLAVALARHAGARVLYVDLDVHHGDGVQAMHWDDPGVLTLSVHQSGRTIFPGTGFVPETGGEAAPGSAVNVPLEPLTGDGPWLDAVLGLVPALGAAFGPDVVVSQHGADAHAFDPLGSLLVTTAAMSTAARCVDAVAHRHAAGRWLATGGGGYDIYRAVPRAWALTWLAGAHRDVPAKVPASWRERWADEARRSGHAPLPEAFLDPPNAGLPVAERQERAEARSREVVALVRSIVVPALLREAEERGWWTVEAPVAEAPLAKAPHGKSAAGVPQGEAPDAGSDATILDAVDPATWSRLRLAPRVLPPADAAVAHAMVLAALRDPRPAHVSAAVQGRTVIGAAVSVPSGEGAERLVALGVAPARRRRGLGRALLGAHVTASAARHVEALLTIGDRDQVQPLARSVRREVLRGLLVGTGFEVQDTPTLVREADPTVVFARWSR